MSDTAALCRYANKMRFPTRAAARAGAHAIRIRVETAGGVFDTLYPYRCPDAPKHWHLSHLRQSRQPCPVCGVRVAAWKPQGSGHWVLNQHDCA